MRGAKLDDEVDDTSTTSNEVTKCQYYRDSSTCVLHGGHGSLQCLAETLQQGELDRFMEVNINTNVFSKM